MLNERDSLDRDSACSGVVEGGDLPKKEYLEDAWDSPSCSPGASPSWGWYVGTGTPGTPSQKTPNQKTPFSNK